ncbi:MAG: PEP-CTERM sorting domain-containing protein [Candidatus Pacearchaeota archaeon]|jgi:hypothetical protein
MNLIKKLVMGGIILFGASEATANFFEPIVVWPNPVSFSGRLSFLGEDYKSSARLGDEIGIFRGDRCIASSNLIDPEKSHYYDLNLSLSLINGILNKTYNIQAFNYETNSLWRAELKGYSLNDYQLHIQAVEKIKDVPEPGSFLLFMSGVLASGLRKNKNK